MSYKKVIVIFKCCYFFKIVNLLYVKVICSDMKADNKLTWGLYVMYVLFGLGLIGSYPNEIIELIIILIISGFSAYKCSEWAKQINKNQNYAFLIGLLFMLGGLLTYWIYFKIKLYNLQHTNLYTT